MQLRFWERVLGTLAALGLSACAEGGAIQTGTGAGGNGVGSTTSGSGGSSSETVTTGPGCVEDPCKLVDPQCGCGVGEQCTLDASGARVCVEAGTVPVGQPCDENAGCAPGGICVGYAGVQTTCAAFCKTDDQCEPPGGLCVLTLDDGTGNPLPDVLLCSENCDLTTSQGCTQTGTSCQLGLNDANVAFTVCGPSGAGTYQALCADTSECAPGFACLPTTNNDDRCFAWCRVGASTCDAGLSCVALEITMGVPLTIGSETFGVCTP